MRKPWIFLLAMLLCFTAGAQGDSGGVAGPADTARRAAVPVQRRLNATPTYNAFLLLDSARYNRHSFITFTHPARQLVSVRQWEGKEAFFYATIGLLIFFAFVKNTFARYSNDLFSLFFRTTVKQRQVKEQLMQAPLPSLLLNVLFFLTGGLFINLLLGYAGMDGGFNFWVLLLYCIAALAVVYTVKFLILKLCGWLFRIMEATDTYTFVVFTTNKVIGVVLLPFIILLSFTSGIIQQVAASIGVCAVVFLFLYRYFLSYMSIHRQIRINIFHFLLYLAAFEVLPLLLINKLLFQFLGGNS